MNSHTPGVVMRRLHQLNAAFDTYLHHEALSDARRVGRELRRLGVERRIVSHPRAKTGWGSLTDSELKVVHLIAEGATNSFVATQLYLSPHTVKTYLRNAFAKLGINSRAQLTQLMHGSDEPSSENPRAPYLSPGTALKTPAGRWCWAASAANVVVVT